MSNEELEATEQYIKQNNPMPTGRARVLKLAAEATLQDRNKQYGNPEDNFKNIAEVWNWYLEGKAPPGKCLVTIDAIDVAHMQVLMKMARLKTNPTHLDSIVDVAGYAACAGDFCVGPMEKTPPLARVVKVDEHLSKIRVGENTWLFEEKYWRWESSNGCFYSIHAASTKPENLPIIQ